MTWIKICGITNREDALAAVSAGTNALGFVFYEKSPRRVTAETVKSIISELPLQVEKIGVFVNETVERVQEIVAALEQSDLRSLAQTARDHGLDVLCEAHDELELQRALDAGCNLIGINSRNLRTFQVDLATPFRLAEKIPASCLRVAESGIRSGADVASLRAAGYDAFLIGESLMKAANPGAALVRLREEAATVVSSQ